MRAYLRAIVATAVAVPLLALAACDETIDAVKLTDAGTTADTGTSADAGPTSTLYDRLGGGPGINALVDAIIAEEVKDPEIASYFVFNVQTTPPAGHPTVADIKACIALQITAAIDSTKGTYPGKVASGYQCRDMKTAHAMFHIGNGTFDKFAAIAVQVATAAAQKSGTVTADDLKLVGTFLASQKPLIVDPAAPDSGFFDAGLPPADSGANDAADSGG